MARSLRVLTLALGLLAIAILPACNRGTAAVVEAASEDEPATYVQSDEDFLVKAAQANLSEIDMARAAMKNSQNSDVKNFANMIQSDHQDAQKDLTDLMRAKAIAPPGAPTREAKAELDRMSALSGSEFDREFANAMVSDHEKAVEIYRDELNIARNAEVRDYADHVLPELELHLEKAQQLQSRLFGGDKR